MQLTDACHIDLKDKNHLLRLLHVLAATEEEATTQYEQVIAALGSDYSEVRDALTEIKTDELNHTGILINLISKLDPSEGKAMIDGGKELK